MTNSHSITTITDNHVARVAAKFWNLANRTSDDKCWEWTGLTNGVGYGSMYVTPEVRLLAHRLAFRICCGSIPPGLLVCHRCDNPKCVNPRHLFLGTHGDNIRDAVTKKRHVSPFPELRGESNYAHKLSEEDVRVIRATYRRAMGGRSRPDSSTSLGKRFGVTPHVIIGIAKGTMWKHVR